MTQNAQRPSLRVGAACHRGLVREENQDRISRFRAPLGEIFLVVDGMGGHEAGGRAAELVIRGFEKFLTAEPADAEPASSLRRAASAANTELYARSAGIEDHKMGATAVLLVLRGFRAVVAHAGDCRAYLLRDGVLEPWTRDHTWVQQMVDAGALSEEEARDHADASVVTRAFGQLPEIEMEVFEPQEMRIGDRIILCSDGLTGYADDEEVASAALSVSDPQEATDRLLDLALQKGGEDNVSVQVMRLDPRAVAAGTARRKTEVVA